MFDRPLGRRALQRAGSWEELRAAFRWRIAPTFNLANALCDSWASFDGDRTALIYVRRNGEVEHWSFARLKEASDRMASAFVTAGIRRGDRVAQILSQGPEALVTHFALLKIGAISVPIFTLMGTDAIAYRLADCGARGVVCDEEQLDKLMSLRGDLPEMEVVWTNGRAVAPVRAFWDDIASAQPLRNFVATGSNDPAFILYTSGSTGPAKGVVHAHKVLQGHLPGVELHHPNFPQPGDLGWTPADWSWIGSLFGVLPCLWYGVSVVSHRLPRFDPEIAWQLILRQGIRNLLCPPSVLRMMRQVPVPKEEHLRSVGTGGELIEPDVVDWVENELGLYLSRGYGLTECNIAIISSPGVMPVKAGTLGLPVPGFDVAILSPDGRELPPGARGEIAIARSTPSMFLRYWNKPEATKAAFVGDWMLTGDIGTRDAEGYFSFVERSDEIITTAGYRLGPYEIEAIVNEHPSVRLSAAVGERDPIRTEIVVVYVVLKGVSATAGPEGRDRGHGANPARRPRRAPAAGGGRFAPRHRHRQDLATRPSRRASGTGPLAQPFVRLTSAARVESLVLSRGAGRRRPGAVPRSTRTPQRRRGSALQGDPVRRRGARRFMPKLRPGIRATTAGRAPPAHAPAPPAFAPSPSLHGDGLRQVAGLVHVGALRDCRVVRQ